jgi:hypothetical protein
VESPGTETSDVVCTGCPSGSFSSEANADSCVAFTDCQEGEFVAETGSANKDRSCETCPEDTYSVGLNSGSCVAVGDCAPGTVEITPAEGLTPAECEDCEPGQFCAGGKNVVIACGEGDWDDDEDPRTPCVAQTLCGEGEYVVGSGSPTTDRTCAACPEETFTEEPLQASCREWQDCEEGSYVALPGSSTADRECSPCPAGTFSGAENASACTAWSVCSAPGSYELEEPSATEDRRCAACTAPEVTFEDNEAECVVPVFQMDDGSVVMEGEHFHVQDRNDSNHQWQQVSLPLASGGSCMDINPEAEYQWSQNIALDFAPRLDFRVNFTSTGTFFIHLRGNPGSGGAGADSAFAGVDGALGPVYDFDDGATSWSWRSQGFNVNSTGQHIVNVWASEDGFCLDKIVVSSSATSPMGAGPDESPQR